MRIHRSLLWLTLVNFIGCTTFFGFLYWYSRGTDNDKAIVEILGWIFWLGLFAVIAPQCFSDSTRASWFSKEYTLGTLGILFINIFVSIGGNVLAATLVK